MPYINRQDIEPLLNDGNLGRELITEMPKESIAMNLLTEVPAVNAAQAKFAVLDTLPTASWIDNKGDDGLKPLTEMAWKDKYIYYEEMAAIVPFSENVLADANTNIISHVTPRLTESMAKLFDNTVFFKEKGAKPVDLPDGLVYQAIDSKNTVVDGQNTDQFLDYSDMMGQLETRGYRGTAFVVDGTTPAKLRNARDNNGRPIYAENLAQGAPNSIYGIGTQIADYDIWDSSVAHALLGDWRFAVYAVRQDITFKYLDQATLKQTDGTLIHLPQQDMVAIRCVMRIGWQVANPLPNLVPDGDDRKRFPFSALLNKTYTPEAGA